MGSQQTFYRATGWLLLMVAVTLGALWQHEARGRQVIDVGAPLDEGFVLGFYGRERSDDGRNVTFRWSRPEAELHPWAIPSPAALRLRLLAPTVSAGTPAALSLQRDGHAIGTFTIAPSFRVYTVLLPDWPGEPRLGLHATPLSLPGDPRALGLVLDRAELRALGETGAAALAGELFAFPFLPLGVLLVATAVALAGARWPFPSAAALTALGLLALGAWWQPEARLALAWSLTVGAGAVAAALGLTWLVRRVPLLRLESEQRAVGWLCAVWAVTFAIGFAPWVASDGTGYYAYTRSLILDGDLNFGNEYREMPFSHTPLNPEQLVIAATGHYVNPYSIGPGLLWVPGFVLADLFVRYGPGGYWAADGYSLPYIALTLLTTALAGLGLLLTMQRICRRVVGPALAALATLAVFFGANPCYYTLREGSFAHGLSALAAALFVLAWLRLEERPTPGRWATVGAAAGLTVLLYWTSALTLLPVGLSLVKQLGLALRADTGVRGRTLRELAVGVGLATLCGLALVTPQLIAWNIIYGTPLTVPQGTSYITPGELTVWPFFFAPLHGMLPWTPAYFVGLLGLALLVARRPWLGLALSLGCAAFLLYNMSISDWHSSGAFGLRRLTVLAPWCALGLAMGFAWLRRLHWSVPVALAALMATWTTLLSWRYSLYLIDRNVGDLNKLPLQAFWLGRDALPLFGAGDWAATGFFANIAGLLAGGAPWTATLTLAALVAGLAAAGVALALWVGRIRPASERDPAVAP